MNKKGADTFPFAFTGSLRMKTRCSHRTGCPHRIGMNIDLLMWAYGQSSSIEVLPLTAFRLLLLRKRNQFLRLFLYEREIIVNALFLLKCLEAASAESMRKGTKKLAKDKMKWDLFSFLYSNITNISLFYIHFSFSYNNILSIQLLIVPLYL